MSFDISEEVTSLTVHGLPRVVSSKSRIGKIFWLIWFLFVLGALLVFVKVLSDQHKKHNVIQIRSEFLSDEMMFPAITFCNTNYFDEKSIQLASDDTLPESCSKKLNDSHFSSFLSKLYFTKACETFLAKGTSNFSSLVFESWSFPTHFTIQRNAGPCFTLNRDGKLKQKATSSIKTGIDMMLFMNESDVGDNNDAKATADERNGLLLSVHDQSLYSEGLIDEGIQLPTGYHTLISLKKIEIKRLPSPFPSKCVTLKKGHYADVKQRDNKKLCIYSCFSRLIYEKCGILTTFLKALLKNSSQYSNPKNLSADEREICHKRVYEDFSASSCDCPTPCFEVGYEVKVSRRPWPKKWYAEKYLHVFADALNKTTSEIDTTKLKENFLKVSIYFESFVTSRTKEEELYDLKSLFGDIGGYMGLTIGMSIISMTELFILLGKFIKSKFRKKKITPEATNKDDVEFISR
eukprot:gene18853-20752_t